MDIYPATPVLVPKCIAVQYFFYILNLNTYTSFDNSSLLWNSIFGNSGFFFSFTRRERYLVLVYPNGVVQEDGG